MRLSIICALFVGAVIAIPHGAQEHEQRVQQSTTASASMSSTMPMKRATSTTSATPSASMEAQKRMLPYEYEIL
ncbi:hypothetical protein N7471_005771 [Penicillium samsonianum]|uniref:uncharacterized protein n=1 Tax=Penicillium samsonianum TaxID=1882272 RepID=UPI0025499AAB|nr:uncharacterized protein N7471_005771 [Penicillium samsonianum]KAJ6139285.1 hypothetical protein N7471_005771 [Penicillium samsonianum]